MAFYHHITQLPSRFRLALSSFMQSEGLAFADVLPEEVIQQAFDEEGAGFAQDEDAIYTPPLTLWAFLSQVLYKEEARSCAAAVARVVVLLVALGKKPPSDDTGVYCRSRAKLSEKVLHRLTCEVAVGPRRSRRGLDASATSLLDGSGNLPANAGNARGP